MPGHPFELTSKRRREFPLASPGQARRPHRLPRHRTRRETRPQRLAPVRLGRRFPSLLPGNRPFRRHAGRLPCPRRVKAVVGAFGGAAPAALANAPICRDEAGPARRFGAHNRTVGPRIRSLPTRPRGRSYSAIWGLGVGGGLCLGLRAVAVAGAAGQKSRRLAGSNVTVIGLSASMTALSVVPSVTGGAAV